jgi:hypothetical protein
MVVRSGGEHTNYPKERARRLLLSAPSPPVCTISGPKNVLRREENNYSKIGG